MYLTLTKLGQRLYNQFRRRLAQIIKSQKYFQYSQLVITGMDKY